ncbi:MAG: hypothetical protein HQ519_06035, partial [Planctomycetes bacterium]|nr:hypothetical protein [Planctomycetota bacterium]
MTIILQLLIFAGIQQAHVPEIAAAPKTDLAALGFRVEAAPDWDALFDLETGGWT